MLLSGGNAVDAALATLLCNGLCAPQSMGIGEDSLWPYTIGNVELLWYYYYKTITLKRWNCFTLPL